VVVKNAIVSEKTIDNVFDELTDAIELLEHLPIPEKEQEKIHDRISLAYKQMHNYLCQEINKYASVLEADIASRQKELDSQQVLLDQARKYLGQKRD
jgi:3-phosphoglycerate kinase